VLAAAAVIYTQYFGVLLLVALHLAFLPGVVRRRRQTGNSWRPWFALAGATLPLGVLLLPLASFALDQFATNEASGRGFDQPAQAGGDVAETGNEITPYSAITNGVWALWGYHSGSTMARLGALWPFAMLGALLMLGRGTSPSSRRIVAAAFVPIGLLTLVATQKPFLFELRYALPCVPFLLLLLARAISTWPRGRVAPVVVAALATLTMIGGLADQQLNGTNPRFYDFQGALSEVNDRADRRDVVLYEPPFLNNVIDYYRPQPHARRLDAERLPRLRRGQKAYVMASFMDKPQHRAAVRKAVGRLRTQARLTDRFSRSQVRIWEFTR